MYTEQLHRMSVWADVKQQLSPYLQSLSIHGSLHNVNKNINIKLLFITNFTLQTPRNVMRFVMPFFKTLSLFLWPKATRSIPY